MEDLKPTKNFFAIIRHGERSDRVGFKMDDTESKALNWDNKIDPPLTPFGIKQAETTG
jgi:broad specificity phosphatase PhoE